MALAIKAVCVTSAGMVAVGASDTVMVGLGGEFIGQATTPAAPSSGNYRLYFKTDGKLYKQTSAGTETEIGGAGGILEEAIGGAGNIRRKVAYTNGTVGTPGMYATDLQGSRSSSVQTASGDYAGILAGINNKASSNYSVVVGGSTNTVSSAYGFVGAGNNNSVTNMSGFVGAGTYNAVSGDSAGILCGYNNQVSGNNSAVITGSSNVVSGNNAVAMGSSNTSSNYYSTCIGVQNESNQTASVVMGYYGKSQQYNDITFGMLHQTYGVKGYSQVRWAALTKQTSNATPTLLGDGIASKNYFTIPTHSLHAFEVIVVGRSTTANAEVCAYKIEGLISRGSTAAVTIHGTPTTTVIHESSAGYDAVVGEDDTNGGMTVTVTGNATKSISWIAVAKFTELNGTS